MVRKRRRHTAAYVLDTFPIVRRHDKAAFAHCRSGNVYPVK